ncbi:AMP-binding protein [Saccharopolyspora spinosa]|uniref:Crotonobetaine/carnitine-CoA ligase n=1 Tax=Saccharopolyspora spinosa TaxID=60894 RepID=A0A2N3Y0P6_SACSN|nr:AMP-binding protein [Saccharopolyspora spinosa]PKW16431.1 crotonobetaine/carnitine-CoA ligase [Saccharopolyspora spinosa]
MDSLLQTPPPDLILPQLLAHHAEQRPRQPFLRSPATTVDYADACNRVESYASGMRAAGIEPGDRVALFMVNSVEHVLIWLALNRVGAVNIPLNTALSGSLLARAVELVRPAAVVSDAEFAPVLDEVVDAAMPFFVHQPAESPTTDENSRHRSIADLRGEGPVVSPPIDRLAPATMLFTSGSTGVPKACVLSHHYLVRQGQIHAKYLGFRSDDVLYTPFPLFHIDAATLTVGAALATGATAALGTRFSASRFWDEVRACGATVFNFMGATANILWKQPASDRDRDHRVRLAWGVPMPACEPGWEERFGHPLVEVYGLTDAGVPAYQPLDEARQPGSCGRVVPEYHVRIADAAGNPVAAGTEGEILIRSDEPGLVMNEYFAMPESTDKAFRDGWFHTGDIGSLDERGNLYFVTRSKEVIRRRGENIAATDVEAGVDAHPAVRESAAVGVPSELSEDDIKVFVVRQADMPLTARDVVEHCERTLPRHMVPRYVELVPELPKTPTEKIERSSLAARPLTSATWDDRSRPHTAGRARHDLG